MNQGGNPALEKKESTKQTKSSAAGNIVKQKVSPHRAQNKRQDQMGQPKKQGVVILD